MRPLPNDELSPCSVSVVMALLLGGLVVAPGGYVDGNHTIEPLKVGDVYYGFFGTVPTELGRLTKLEVLDLSNNYLNVHFSIISFPSLHFTVIHCIIILTPLLRHLVPLCYPFTTKNYTLLLFIGHSSYGATESDQSAFIHGRVPSGL